MNKIVLTIASLALGSGVLLTSVSSAMAYRGDPNVQGPYYTAERHEAMTKAFENNDYNAWKSLMGKGRITQVVNEGNFSLFAQAHKLMLEGKKDEAGKIRAELGLGLHNGSGQGKGYGRNK